MKIILRILISLGILIWLFSKIDLQTVRSLIIRTNPLIYIFSMVILLIHQYTWSYMWKLALRQKGYAIKNITLFKAMLTSYFLGIFLPSAIGPDIILTFTLGKSLPEKQHAPSSLLFIRIINITGILLVSGIVLIFISNTLVLRHILILTWTLLLMVWICYWLAIHPRSKKIIEQITKRYQWLRFLYKIFHSFHIFGLDNKITIKIWLLGLIMTFLKVLIDYSIALSLGIHIPYVWFLGLIPSISIISLLPVSIAGLGIREGAYIGVFSNMGIPPANSLSISLVVFTLTIWLSIIGGIFYLIQGVRIKSRMS